MYKTELNITKFEELNPEIQGMTRAQLFDYVFAHAKEIQQPDFSNCLDARLSDQEYEEKYKRYFTEYNPTYDPELDCQVDDVPYVPDFNQDFVGEFDSGLKPGSVPERATSQFWDML